MESPNLDPSWASSTYGFLNGSFNVCTEGGNPADFLPLTENFASYLGHKCNIPKPPPLPGANFSRANLSRRLMCSSYVPTETKETWDKLFNEGYGSDVHVLTDDKTIILAHSSVLGNASLMLRNLLQQAKVKDGIQSIKIHGVPYEAVHAFIRFLYSSCYEQEVMKKFVLHLLVLSHSFSIPSLKRICIDLIEKTWLTTENIIDVLQLARECDAPCLSLICVRMVVKDFKTISSTEGWKVMKHTDPAMEQELLGSVVEADSKKQEKIKKMEERKMYLQIHEAMEALLHICRDGCRMIGPRNEVPKGIQVSCSFPACKGIESLVRHFSNCKIRVSGRCIHCKRMWQLLELHSCMCNESDCCKVPLCRHFKEKMQQQSKKEEAKWKLLVSKVKAAKNAAGSFWARCPS